MKIEKPVNRKEKSLSTFTVFKIDKSLTIFEIDNGFTVLKSIRFQGLQYRYKVAQLKSINIYNNNNKVL
jgi:hypothetical protein